MMIVILAIFCLVGAVLLAIGVEKGAAWLINKYRSRHHKNPDATRLENYLMGEAMTALQKSQRLGYVSLPEKAETVPDDLISDFRTAWAARRDFELGVTTRNNLAVGITSLSNDISQAQKNLLEMQENLKSMEQRLREAEAAMIEKGKACDAAAMELDQCERKYKLRPGGPQ